MSSSDSEDDCYGNVAEKLQKMKNSYKYEKLQSSNVLNESSEIDKILKSADNGPKPSSSSATDVALPSTSDSFNNTDDDIELDKLIAANRGPSRKTRKAAKSSVTDVALPTTDKLIASNQRPKRKTKNSTKSAANEAAVLPEPAPKRAPRGRKSTGANTSQNATTRGRGRGRQTQRSIDAFLQNVTAPATRGRSPGRGRGRRRQPDANLNALQALIPVFSVGNTYEYPDQSESQELFSNKQKNDEEVVVVEEDPLDDNEELSVKVYWQSSELFKFTIRRYQKLTQIFEYFSNKENVSFDNLLFTFNDKILKADDTPDSIDYNIGKFIDGGVVNKSVSQLVKKDSANVKDGIKIKFLCQNLKKPIEMTISMEEKMLLSMRKCAEHLEKPIEKLRFVFDGENLSAKSSPRELELEGGECIDVKILS